MEFESSETTFDKALKPARKSWCTLTRNKSFSLIFSFSIQLWEGCKGGSTSEFYYYYRVFKNSWEYCHSNSVFGQTSKIIINLKLSSLYTCHDYCICIMYNTNPNTFMSHYLFVF